MSLVKQHNNNSSGHHSRSKTPFFSGVQAKLNVGKPGDKYEKEADQVADQIVAGKNAPEQTPFFSPAPNVNKKGEDEQEVQQKPLGETITPLVQLKEDEEIQSKEEEEIQQQEEEEAVQTKAEEEDVQMQEEEEAVQAKSDDEDLQTSIADFNIQEKPMFSKDIEPNVQKKSEEEIQEKEDEEVQEKEEEESIQKSADTGTDSSPGSSFENNLSQSKGGGSPMDNSTREGMESGFGKDFSGVRIHNDDNAVQMNKDLGSQAFTNGNDIYFNEGKYNPGTKEGDHLLAHELTHTVQQGASTDPSQSVQKQEQAAGEPQESTRPGTPIDITHRFELTDAWAQYLDGEYENGERSFEVDVKIGERYSGTILVRKLSSAEGETAKYDLVHTSRQNYLEINGWSFLDPLRQAGVTPILVLKRFGDEQTTKGFLSAKIGDTALTSDVLGIVKGINENLEAMQFLGIEPIEIPTGGMENTFEAGRLLFQVSTMSTVVDGFLEAGGGMGITGDAFTFNLNANVDVAGLASGEFTIARGEDGKLSGTGQIQAEIANVQATISVEYIDGAVTIQGTGRIESEKFSGEITLLVTDEQKSKQMMHAALGVETMDAEAESSETEAAPKTRNNQVLAGWGEVTASITPWLEGTAKVGIDADGHVTIVGEIVVPEEIELMEQRGKKVDIFSVEIRAGYGIPLVGQVFLFASIGMFMNAGFGPLVLKDVGFTGTYSTDPSVLQEFAVTGTLGINAFAVLGLEAEAGVGLTLLGHDVKAGVNVTAAAGLRAYAEATPTLEYKEQATPEGGKAGETRLKGHFEAAAQLFLQLSGALFVELDSPWWSPAPDGREEYPLGEVQYPIGDSMGIGADMDWLVGSNEIPELSFSPVEFDPDKFTADVMADPPPRKRGNSDAEEAGQWEDGNSPGNQSENPEMRDGEGLPKNDKKEEDLKNLPDEQKYMRALDEMSKLENANPKPTEAVVNAKATKVKRKYGIDRIQVTPKGDEAEIFVKHKREDNGNHKLKVPLMSEAERMKLLQDANQDLEKRSDAAANEDGTIEESAARDLLSTWKNAHPVIEDAKIKDGEDTWDYEIDLGDKEEIVKGKGKVVIAEESTEGADQGDGEIGKVAKFQADNEDHKLWIKVTGRTVEVMVASIEMSVSERLAGWNTALSSLEESKRAEARTLLANAQTLYTEVFNNANTANQEQNEAEANPSTENSEQAAQADELVEQSEDRLKVVLANLFEIFGEGTSEFDASLVQAYVNFKDERRRLYLEKSGEDLILKLENENPASYRAFIAGIDLSQHKDPTAAQKALDDTESILAEIDRLKALRADKGSTEDARDAFNEQKAKDLDAQVELLVPLTKVLFERASDIPPSSTPSYTAMSGPPGTVASSMTIEILTSEGPDGSVPTTAKHELYDKLNKRRNGGTSYYVKGHMLNHNVHGPGKYENLTPLSVAGNKAHLLNVENTVKIAVSSGAVVKYIVKTGPAYNVNVPSVPEMNRLQIPSEHHQDMIDVRSMEKYVPQYLEVSAWTLREDGDSGNFTNERDIVKGKLIKNEVDTDMTKYQFGAGSSEKPLVLTSDSPDDIATLVQKDKGHVSTICNLVINNSFKQFRSIESKIDALDKSVSEKRNLKGVVTAMKTKYDDGKLKIYEK